MRDLNISNYLVNTIEWLYGQTAFYDNNKELFIGTGVIQGCVLSPTLFLIMFTDLLNELEEAGLDVFAYADDLAIVG